MNNDTMAIDAVETAPPTMLSDDSRNDCYWTWIAKIECAPVITTGCPYVTKNIGDRGSSCRDGKVNVAGLCYNPCKPEYEFAGGNICQPKGGPGIKTTLMDRQYCNNDEEMKAGLCYKKPIEVFHVQQLFVHL